MFKRRTTLVVGAGCSYEYGLPIGDTLKDQIAKDLDFKGLEARSGGGDIIRINSDGPDDILTRATNLENNETDGAANWQSIADRMSSGIAQVRSIDRYLQAHNGSKAKVAIGKMAIARAILRAEEKSLISGKFDVRNIKKKNGNEPHWLQELFYRLQEDIPIGQPWEAFSNLTIITFNYDRVIEHYLYHALQAWGDYDADVTAKAMSKLNIVHPYGKIGRLPWQPNDGTAHLPFGQSQNLHPDTIREAGRRLRTFTETLADDDDVLGPLHSGILTADQIIFLGFSFLPQNLKLMSSVSASEAETIHATSYGESASNLTTAERDIKEMLRGDSMRPFNEIGLAWHNLRAGHYLNQFGNELAS